MKVYEPILVRVAVVFLDALVPLALKPASEAPDGSEVFTQV